MGLCQPRDIGASLSKWRWLASSLEPRIPCAVEGSNAGTALAVTGQHARSRTVSGSGKGGQR